MIRRCAMLPFVSLIAALSFLGASLAGVQASGPVTIWQAVMSLKPVSARLENWPSAGLLAPTAARAVMLLPPCGGCC